MRIIRTCDSCKEQLRKIELYETLNEPQWKNLCKKCFNLWLDDKLEVKHDN